MAQVYGLKLTGWPAWLMHRAYHVARMPTLNRKVRIVADWLLASLFRREVIALGQVQDPRREFVAAARGADRRELLAAAPMHTAPTSETPARAAS